MLYLGASLFSGCLLLSICNSCLFGSLQATVVDNYHCSAQTAVLLLFCQLCTVTDVGLAMLMGRFRCFNPLLFPRFADNVENMMSFPLV